MAERVLVAMSGGVDSSACVSLLQKQGYEVGGVVFDMSPAHHQAVEDARLAADFFGVPLTVCNLRERFSRQVIDYFCQSYLSGETPNPCVRCNPTVKFAALYEEMRRGGYDWMATGHYAGIVRRGETYYFTQAQSAQRDQSYMLYRLPQEIMARLLLPLAGMEKPQVRQLAREAGLPTFDKPDSQENCFIPDGDYPAYVEGRCGPSRRGQFIAPDGSPAGPHRGIAHYTVGQRKGLGIALGRPVFVRAIDPASGDVLLCDAGEEYAGEVRLREVCAPDPAQLAEGAQVLVKIRSVAKPCPATLHPLPGGGLTVRFATPQRAPAPGQSAVFYRDGLVIGGGIIDRPRPENGGAAGGPQTTA